MMEFKKYWNDYWVNNSSLLPWTTNVPDHNLVSWISTLSVLPTNALDIGCGDGINTAYMNSLGINVLGIDIADLAIQTAKQRYNNITFYSMDIFDNDLKDKFDLIYDRGCFHLLDHDIDRKLFVKKVKELLSNNGVWISIIGSTESKHDTAGPPKRSLHEIVTSIEPQLYIERIESTYTELNTDVESIKAMDGKLPAWKVFSRLRT